MDWGYKAVLTAMTVAAVLMTARLFGRRVAGLVAGLPVITAPSLLWLALEQGAAYAAHCAIGSVAACGAAAVFAVTYERAARRHGPLLTLALALAGGGAVALLLAPLTAGSFGLSIALLSAFALGVFALRALPAAPTGAQPLPPLRGQLLLTAALAGAVSAVLAAAAPWLGAFWAGLLAGLPIISCAVLLHQHLTASHGDRQRFLQGYTSGLLGKTAFAGVFASAAVSLGPTMAMATAVTVGIAAALAVTRTVRPVRAAAEAPAAGVLAKS